MAVLTPDEILDLTRRIRSGEVADETLTNALIDITDTVNELNSISERSIAAADAANAAAATAKAANAELYARLSAVDVKQEAENSDDDEVKQLDYEDIFEVED